jgi:hypothetical protein
MTRRGRLNLLLTISGVALALWWMRPPSPENPSAGAPATPLATASVSPAAVSTPPPPAAPAPPPPAAVQASVAPEADAAVDWPDDVPRETLDVIESDPVLRERARQHMLAAEADARWEDAVDRGGFTADDLDPAVRALFGGLTLEPRYAEGGMIEGLWLGAIRADHPLAQAGFQEGDLLDSLQGVPLRDPAALPGLLARLGPEVEVCAIRSGTSVCREIVLE